MMRIFLIATAIGLLGMAAAPSFAGEANTNGAGLTLDPSTKPSTGGGQGFQQAINPSTGGLQSFPSKRNAQKSGGPTPENKIGLVGIRTGMRKQQENGLAQALGARYQLPRFFRHYFSPGASGFITTAFQPV
jgi:hypothetical protein